jgi:hypothetical protein
MFDDYRAVVLAAYQELQAAGALSSNLNPLTRGGLKKACAAVLHERYRKEDEKVLRDFFGPRESEAAYQLAIKQYDAEKFKTLQKFLKGEYSTTNATNVELLAWLIDFQPRPYRYGHVYTKLPAQPVKDNNAAAGQVITTRPGKTSVSDNSSPGEDDQPDQNRGNLATIPQETAMTSPLGKPKFQNRMARNAVVSLILLSLAGSGTYLIWNHGKRANGYAARDSTAQCMYWKGDVYQPIPCNQKSGDAPVIALDTNKLTHFKRITLPDTLTANSDRKVWYLKLNNHVVFYTGPGFDPVHPERRLKPMTDNIRIKYAHQN